MMTTVVLSPAAARPSGPQPSSGSALVSSLAAAAAVTPPQDKTVAAALDLESGGNVDGKSLGAVVDENASVNVQPGQEKEAATAQQQPLRHAKRAASPELQRAKKKRRRVAFEAADIVEFEPTVFTTSVTSGGIPLGMSLKERSRTRRRLDSFELERKEHRVERQNYMEEGYLDPQERELILNHAGCEEPTLLSVEAEVNQIIADRRESNEIDFEFLYGLADMEEEEDESNQVMLEDEQEADDDEEEEEEEDGDESNQEDDTVSAFLSTSTTLEESSSETEGTPDNNSTDEDVASS